MEEIYAVAHKFTAFMCCSDYYAVTLMKYLKAKGIRFPEDLSITGFDDNLYAQLACPSLTTIHQDIFSRGTIAAEYLFKMIDGWNPKTTNLSLPVRLVVRDSVKIQKERKSRYISYLDFRSFFVTVHSVLSNLFFCYISITRN